jgi:putative transposase
MPRIARVVIPGVSHMVTQRGNRKQITFFSDNDYLFYLKVLADWCRRYGVENWAYCLMPNHVHLIFVPESGDGLRRAIGEAHKRYSGMVNVREGWKGHLWQGRFFSYPLDEAYLLAAVRHIEMNPVRAGLSDSPGQYPWSSARAHLIGCDDVLVDVRPLLDRVANWIDFLAIPVSTREVEALRRHEKTGRPLGNAKFIAQIEQRLNRVVRRGKPGPKTSRTIENPSPFIDGGEREYRPKYVP